MRSFAGLVALNLSLEQRLTDVVGKVSQASWERTFTRSPSWFDFYFTPPLESLERVRQLKGVKGSAVTLEPGMDLLRVLSKDGQRLSGPKCVEVTAIHSEVVSREVPVTLNVEEAEVPQILEELAVYKAVVAIIRAYCFYGQGMHSLIAAGQRGNDKGYVLAVSIDPTVQWHPAVLERVSREAIAGRTAFASKLRKAAESGPSQRIDKDLHQLRYMLGIFEELGHPQEARRCGAI
ncbi:MAG: hypothetical protein V9G29_19385 [Burkholderiaceae bacterium]